MTILLQSFFISVGASIAVSGIIEIIKYIKNQSKCKFQIEVKTKNIKSQSQIINKDEIQNLKS